MSHDLIKLIRYKVSDGEGESVVLPGFIDSRGVCRDLSAKFKDESGTGSPWHNSVRDRVLGMADYQENCPPLDEPALVRCVGGVGKIIGIGLNYSDHAAETNSALPTEPIVFQKASSALSGDGDVVHLLRGSEHTDWEVELGVVIGAEAKYVSEEEALSYVLGYCVAIDYTERRLQGATAQWTKGKSADGYAAIGSELAIGITDPQNLSLWLEVDDERVQSGHTGKMIFSVAQLVAHVSSCMRLEPGDVIMTGTPPGVGAAQSPPRFLRAGQRVRAGIEGIGVLNQRIEQDS